MAAPQSWQSSPRPLGAEAPQLPTQGGQGSGRFGGASQPPGGGLMALFRDVSWAYPDGDPSRPAALIKGPGGRRALVALPASLEELSATLEKGYGKVRLSSSSQWKL